MCVDCNNFNFNLRFIFDSFLYVFLFFLLIFFKGHVIEATQKSLYFKRQPDSEYFFDSTQKSLVLDCTTGPIQTNRINWIKDNKGDALGYVSMQRYDTDFKR